MFDVTSQRLLLLCAGALAAASTLALAAGAEVPRADPDAAATLSRAPAARPLAASAEQRAAFAPLRRARDARDALPDEWVGALDGEMRAALHGQSPDLARRIRYPGRAIWLTGGAGTVCLVIALAGDEGGQASSCLPTAEAVRGGVVLYETDGNGGSGDTTRVTGLVPDEVSVVTLRFEGDRAATTPVRDNVYQFTTSAAVGVLFTARDGSTREITRIQPGP